MANTRPFTYNNGSPIDGNSQIGNLAYGNLNDVNGGDDYSGDPGGEKWWMGPDEDNRYIIAKDVPAKNWPTQVPEGNIGSVRFWATINENDSEFVNQVNDLPARSGLTPFSQPYEAYAWLIDNGYWTNYPLESGIFAGWKTYRNPATTTQDANQIVYSPTQNTAYVNTRLPSSFSTQYGNFYATNFSSTLVTQSVTDYQGDTTYLPITESTFSGDDIGQGLMVLDDDKNHLYVCVSDNEFGVIKYDISNNTVLWGGLDPGNNSISGNITSPAQIQYESGSNKLIIYNSLDGRILLADADTGDSEGYVSNNGSVVQDVDLVIPGPDNRALVIRENTNNHKILNTDTQTYITNISLPSPYPSGGPSIQYMPIYVSSKNKWYVPFRAAGSTTTAGYYENYIAVINGDGTFDQTIGFGNVYLNSGVIIDHAWAIYDSNRDVIWSISPDGFLCAINPDTGGTVIKTGQEASTYHYSQPFILNNKLIGNLGLGGGVVITSIDLDALYPI